MHACRGNDDGESHPAFTGAVVLAAKQDTEALAGAMWGWSSDKPLHRYEVQASGGHSHDDETR